MGLRILAVPGQVSDVDGVNFARALANFDPFNQAPHFPGYPVYVLLSRLCAALGASEVWALVLPGMLAFSVGTWLCARAIVPAHGDAAAERFLLIMALLPGAVLHLAWPTSDGFGLGLLLIAIGLGARAHHAQYPPWALFVLGALGGLTLGARLSWWPLALGFSLWGMLKLRTAVWPAFAGGGLAVLAFTLPLFLWFSPSDLGGGFLGFADGHFTQWGGTLQTVSALGDRVQSLIWGLGASLFGMAGPSWPTLGMSMLGGLALYGLWSGRHRPPAAWVAIAALYLVWVVAGQNVEKPRHLLPLLPVGAIAMALGLAWVRIPAVGLALIIGAVSLPRSLEQARPAPAAELVRFIQNHHTPAGLQIFAGSEARVFEHLAPNYRVWRAATPDVLQREAARASANGVEVLVTSGALGVSHLESQLTLVGRFETPNVVRAHDHELTLYRYGPQRRNKHATR